MVTWLASHGGGLKADWPWWCGAEKVKEVEGGMQQKELGKKSLLSLCDRICCGKLCDLFK